MYTFLVTAEDIKKIIQQDAWMMDVLRIVSEQNLPDWWIGAGFVRNTIWDHIHDYKVRTPLNDIDVIYFDPKNLSEDKEKTIEHDLRKKLSIPWSVKNQARMAIVRGDGPYTNAEDGLSRWVETATCVGVRLDSLGELKLATPLGIEDLAHLYLRPNPKNTLDPEKFGERIKKKNWLTLWPKLKMDH